MLDMGHGTWDMGHEIGENGIDELPVTSYQLPVTIPIAIGNQRLTTNDQRQYLFRNKFAHITSVADNIANNGRANG